MEYTDFGEAEVVGTTVVEAIVVVGATVVELVVV
jgi:hypothetical protein